MSQAVLPKGAVRVAAFALLFYLVAVGWGTPYATAPDRVKSWGIDDESPLGPLAEVHNILQPKSNQWLSYPLLYSFLAAAAYAPYMLWLLVTGGLSGMSASYPFGFQDPVFSLQVLTVIAHMVSALMAAIAVGAAHEIGRTLSSARTADFYALLVTVSFPLVYYARNGNVDATALAFVGLGTATFSRAIIGGLSRSRAVWLGVFAGLALAAKESSIGVLLAMPLLLLWFEYRGRAGRGAAWPGTDFRRAAGLGLAASLVAFGMGSGLFVDPRRYVAHVRYLRGLLALVAASDTPSVFTFPYTWAGNLGYLSATLDNATDALTLPGILLLLLGAGHALLTRSTAGVPLLLGLTYIAYLFSTYRLVQARYLMPFTYLGLFYVAYAARLAWHSRAGLVRVAGIAIAGLALGRSTLTAVDYTYQMLNDSRYCAAAWLDRHAHEGDVVTHFSAASALPAIPAGVTTELATEFRGMYYRPRLDDAKVREIQDTWRQRQPAYVLIMPDHTSPPEVPYSVTLPPQLYVILLAGDSGYRLMEHCRTTSLFPALRLPRLDYPIVNPPIRIFAATAQVRAESR